MMKEFNVYRLYVEESMMICCVLLTVLHCVIMICFL
ncbi:hypothetical protein ECH_0933 [Ehrlichia chaffeensis str. Arkansas]|uniref:Uncharacterized protein n=1 Tax=Ehrlichia chaffeensis (strain ATCC CRL-10679 / Arkansas) TaxID=205920 RepID=Q2GFR0_EHRCR|nr:hypothetical protein ECH_0933 [Ehrlichia chaffeensis str. Arkansas]